MPDVNYFFVLGMLIVYAIGVEGNLFKVIINAD